MTDYSCGYNYLYLRNVKILIKIRRYTGHKFKVKMLMSVVANNGKLTVGINLILIINFQMYSTV